MFLNIFIILCGGILLSLLAVVLYSDSKAASNRWLGLLIFGGVLWLLANLLANNASSLEANLWFSRFAMLGASIEPFAFLMFCISFTERKISDLLQWLVAFPVILLILSTPTSLNIVSVTAGGQSINPGPAYILLAAVLGLYFAIGSLLLSIEFRRAKLQRRQQLFFILLGVSFTVFPVIILSVILPILGYSLGVSFAPTLVIFFASFTTVAIVRHRLFDIRMFVVRAAAYSITVALLALGYIAPLIFVIMRILHLPFEWPKFVVVTIIGTLAATFYHRVHIWFNHVTERIFFRDSYDPTELLATLNNLLVTTIDLKKLLDASARLIENNLRPSYCAYILFDRSNSEVRFFGNSATLKKELDYSSISKWLSQSAEGSITVDALPDGYDGVREVLKAANVAMIVKLSPEKHSRDATLGYIFVGKRQSGKMYDASDSKVMNTIADTLVLAMQNALHYEEIQRFNDTLQSKVEEATRKLKATNDKLKKMDETKDEFISMASHQLRTPLTSVKGYVSMVLDGDVGPITPQQRELLNQSFQSSQRMANLISDLLNLSRINTGKFIIEDSPVHLPAVIEAELGQLREMAAAKNITLHYQATEPFPTLMLDDNKMHQVVMNLIDNAIYYTPEGGTVTIELLDTPKTIEFRVIDTGIGVPRESQKHLFSKMFRAENARRARPDGTGLGLFMVKKVIIEQKGVIIFETEENKGSVFGFRFSKADHLVEETTDD